MAQKTIFLPPDHHRKTSRSASPVPGGKFPRPGRKGRTYLRSNRRIGIGIGGAAFFWIAESAVKSLLLHDGEFTAQLVPADGHDLFLRAFIAGMLIFIGAYSQLSTRHRRRAEADLRESETRYREIASNLPGVVYQFKLKRDGSFVFPSVSEGVYQIYGLTPEEITTAPHLPFDLVAREDLDAVFRSIADSAATLTTWTKEFNVKNRFGQERRVWGSATPRALPDGDILWDGVLIDITRRKRAEEALEESEKFSEIITQNVSDFIWIMSLDLTFTYLSPSISRLTGHTEQEALALPLNELLTPESYALAVRTLQEELAIEEQEEKDLSRSRTLELEINRKDGGTVWAEHRMTFLRNEAQKPTAIVGTSRDITERLRTERELQEIRERYQMLSENITDVIWIMDRGLRPLYISPSIERFRGYSVEEVMGQAMEDYLTPASLQHATENIQVLFANLFSAEGSGQTEETLELEFLHKNGSTVWGELRLSVLYDSAHNFAGMLGICRDITARKQAEEALKNAYDELERRVQERTEELADSNLALEEKLVELTLIQNTMRRQYELALALRDTHSVYEALKICVETALRISGMDVGAAFLAGERPRDFTLTFQTGLSGEFTADANRHDLCAFLFPLISEGKAYFSQDHKPEPPFSFLLNREGIRTLAVLPVSFEGNLLACLWAGSKQQNVIPPATRQALENIAAQVGSIVARLQAEETLRESEEKFRTLVEHAIEGIAVAQDGVVKFINSRGRDIVGYSREELIAKSFEQFIHPDDLDGILPLAEGIARGESFADSVQFRIIDREGSTRWIEANSVTVEWEGRPAGMSFFQDISERKESADHLRESEEKIRIMFESMGEGIVVTDLKGTITEANEVVTRLGGFSGREEILESNIFDFVAEREKNRMRMEMQKTLAQGRSGTQEFTLTRTDGTEFTSELNASVLKNRQGEPVGFVGLVRDITMRKVLDELVRKQHELGIALGAATNLEEAARLCVRTAIQVSGMDCGGLYLVDEKTGGLKLIYQEGFLLEEFVRAASYYDAGSPQARLVMEGWPIYTRHQNLDVPLDDVRKRESLRALAVIPIRHRGKVAACLNVGSHTLIEVPASSRHALETITTYIGGGIARIRLEEILKNIATEWTTTFDTMSDPIMLIDLDYRVTRANRAMSNLLGLPFPRIIGQPCYRLIHGTASPPDFCLHSKTVSNDREYSAEIFDENRERDFLVTFTPMHDTAGALSGTVHVMRDITERKRAEKQLRASEERYRTLVETSPDAIVLTDLETNIIMANQQALRLYGIEKEEDIIGKQGIDFLSLPDREDAVRDMAVTAGDPSTRAFEYTFVKQDGRTFPAEIRVSLLQDPEGNPRFFISVIRDLTERKRAEEAQKEFEHKLEEQRVRAISADRLRSLGEMAAGIAHELNQPLSGVRGVAEHILIGMGRHWELSEEKLREKLKLIIDQADRMTHVIEHVRMFARGADHVDLIPVQVNQVIESSTGLIGTQLKSRGMNLECVLAPDLPEVLANPFSLEEVILNLISNARDAIEEKIRHSPHSESPPQIRIRTRRTGNGTARRVKIEVYDEGNGIPPVLLDKVFDPFFTTKDPDIGTGLGLAISRSIVESFGGTIEIQSRPGKGTTVTVSLPAAKRRRRRTA